MADILYPPVIHTALSLYRVLGLSFQKRGWQNIPASGGAIIVSNHISYLDFIFAGTPPWVAHRRLTRFMAKESVFRNKVSGPMMRAMHHIPVDREAGSHSFDAAVAALRNGELVGMFPEATISQSFVVKEMKTGAVRLAQQAGVPLIPMAIWGTQRLWTKGHPRRLTQRKLTVSLLVGEPMTVAPDADVAQANSDLAKVLQRMVDEAQAMHPDTTNPPANAWWLPRHLGGTAPTPAEAADRDAAEKAARQNRSR